MSLKWLAAVLAPWTVSPHLNFRSEFVDAPSVFALVAEFRDEEIPQFMESAEIQQDWERELVTNGSLALYPLAHPEAIDSLALAAKSDQPTPGARAAGALIAAIAYSEFDRHEVGIQLLRDVMDALAVRSDEYEVWLSLRALALQSAMRHIEIGALTEALAVLDRKFPRPERPKDVQFSVSRGISWSSHRVCSDMEVMLRQHEEKLRVRIEGFNGRRWTKIVRSRPNWVDTRIDWRASERDARIRKAFFESTASASINSVTFGGENIPGATAGIGTLLHAELVADLDEAVRAREALAQILWIGGSTGRTPENAQESIRLMRAARSRKGLRSVLHAIRTEGPASALQRQAESILSRPAFPTRCDEFDLEVLKQATDLVPAESHGAILEGVNSFLDSLVPGDIEASRLVMGTLASLEVDAIDQTAIARATLKTLTNSSDSLSYISRDDVLEIVRSIAWDDVEPSVRQTWVDWASLNVNEDQAKAVARSLYQLLGFLDLPGFDDSPTKMQDIVDFLNRAPGSDLGDEDAVSFAHSMLELVRDDVAHHRITVYSWDPAELATLVAIRTGADDLWWDIVHLIEDEGVSPDYTASALSSLASNASRLPLQVANALRTNVPRLLNLKSRKHPMGIELHNSFPSALRLGLALDAVEPGVSIQHLSSMASADDASTRREAVQTLDFAVGDGPSSYWAMVLLIQLCRDSSLPVRIEAARVLAARSPIAGDLSPLVTSVLTRFLESTGVREPLYVLHGLQRVAGVESSVSAQLRSHVLNVAANHPSRVVRGAAALAVSKNE